jgi:hypothetical protein
MTYLKTTLQQGLNVGGCDKFIKICGAFGRATSLVGLESIQTQHVAVSAPF